MIDFYLILIGVIIIFGGFIALRPVFSIKVCALCAAVFTSWLVLLALFYSGSSVDPVLIGLLMGGSVVGIIYLFEQKLSEQYSIFKLPFFLTLVAVSYFLLNGPVGFAEVSIVLLLWAVAVIIYAGRNTNKLGVLGRKIIECCKNW